MENNKPKRPLIFPREVGIHLFAWMLVFMMPLLFMNHEGGIHWGDYFRRSLLPLHLCAVFYLNYLWLVPHILLRQKQRPFIIYNCILVLVTALLMHTYANMMTHPAVDFSRQRYMPPSVVFLFRDTIMCIFAAGLGTALRLSKQWVRAEAARKEAELGRTDAELRNLRNQINPHFLLNTLNNIYALTAFDQTKAQTAIQELSHLLRYLLYENQENFVPIHKECDFLRTYIELMRIRTPRNVEISLNFDIQDISSIKIAPLIFISLIENAFKHGISPTQPSFIHIRLEATEEDRTVLCQIINSNFPKKNSDKSGSGIGLKQVQARLDLLYPQSYTWIKGTNEENTIYTSSLFIYTNHDHHVRTD